MNEIGRLLTSVSAGFALVFRRPIAYSHRMKYPAPLAVAAALFALPATLASAQTGPSLMLAPMAPDQQGQATASAFFLGSDVSQTGADVDLAIIDLTAKYRLHPEASYDPTLGTSYTHFEIDTADAALPEHLVDASVAFGGRFADVDLGETLNGEWQMGYTVGLGYAGTAPFADGDAWYAKGSIFAIQAYDRDSRLVVALEYDGNRVFLPDIPLPALTYFDRWTDTVTYAVGFPFSNLTWTPDDRWTVRLTSFFFISSSARVTYQASDRLELFGAYESRSDAFQLANDNGSRRLIFEQQRLEAGVNYDLTDDLTLTAAAGYAFDQEFDRGYDTRETTSVRDLDDAAYVRVGVTLRF